MLWMRGSSFWRKGFGGFSLFGESYRFFGKELGVRGFFESFLGKILRGEISKGERGF